MLNDNGLTVEEQRLVTKQEMLALRGGPEYAKCDCCRKKSATNDWHMHELVARSKTQGNDSARELSYQPELCSLLCPNCHRYYHDENPEMQQALWLSNYQRYGQNIVLAKLHELQDTMKSYLYIYLPE